jgi:hypothetical protein
MRVRTSGSLALAAVVALAPRAAGQASPPDLRVLALRSLQVGRTVRIAGRDIGTLTGPLLEVREGTLWLEQQPANRMVPIAGIDSMWVKGGGHAGAGALVGGLIGSVVGLAAVSGRHCQLGDTACLGGTYVESAGIALGGLLVGALIGSGMKSWQLRYP